MREHIGVAMFSAGRTLGLRAPDCAKEPLALWTLFIWVAAEYALRWEWAYGYNGDLTGSDLWPGKSRGARRQQVEAALRLPASAS